jgi:anthranilate phosphoribosyltransferase
VGDLAAAGALSAEEAERAFGVIMRGEADPEGTAALLLAMRERGETPAEVAGGVRALRSAMVEVTLPADGLVDTCGTGGGRFRTFNISTVAALVAAGGGVPVAKHGNRSFTSRCGSADVLEVLGVAIDLPPEALGDVFAATSFCFMFAPRFHPAMRHVAPVRRRLGVTTIMNLLGPLTSPARVRRQVVGVSDPARLDLIAGALLELGHERALVVHGAPGMDELSPIGITRGVRLDRGRLEPFELDPAALGWRDLSREELGGGDPERNAALARGILEGSVRGAARAAVVLNAAAAFWAAARAESLEEGVERARSSLDEGRALDVLERLRSLGAERAG